MTSGNKRVTTLTEMATLGGSTRSGPLGVPLVAGTDGLFAANARVPTNVINAAASGVSRKPRRVSKIGISICVLSSSRIIRDSIRRWLQVESWLPQLLQTRCGSFRARVLTPLSGVT